MGCVFEPQVPEGGLPVLCQFDHILYIKPGLPADCFAPSLEPRLSFPTPMLFDASHLDLVSIPQAGELSFFKEGGSQDLVLVMVSLHRRKPS